LARLASTALSLPLVCHGLTSDGNHHMYIRCLGIPFVKSYPIIRLQLWTADCFIRVEGLFRLIPPTRNAVRQGITVYFTPATWGEQTPGRLFSCPLLGSHTLDPTNAMFMVQHSSGPLRGLGVEWAPVGVLSIRRPYMQFAAPASPGCDLWTTARV
jgi:hypothetical protein